MKEFNLISPSLFSPKAKFPKFSEIFSSFKHQRCLSAKSSPYTNPFTERPKSKILSNCQLKKKPGEKPKPKKKPTQKKQKKTGKPKQNNLVEIKEKEVLIAPKIFENQIFKDIYDVHGNHDRILEVSSSKIQESFEDSKIVMGKLEILNDIDVNEKNFIDERRLRPPENSYLEETKAPTEMHTDLLKKLNELALALNNKEDT